jgi:hypothetical protein
MHGEITFGELGHILIAWPSCLAGSTQRYSEPAFLHRILLAEYRMNESIEDCYGMYIITSSFKTKFTRKSQVVVVEIWKPKGIGKTSKEELK